MIVFFAVAINITLLWLLLKKYKYPWAVKVKQSYSSKHFKTQEIVWDLRLFQIFEYSSIKSSKNKNKKILNINKLFYFIFKKNINILRYNKLNLRLILNPLISHGETWVSSPNTEETTEELIYHLLLLILRSAHSCNEGP